MTQIEQQLTNSSHFIFGQYYFELVCHHIYQIRLIMGTLDWYLKLAKTRRLDFSCFVLT
jgi:hypothetical protein